VQSDHIRIQIGEHANSTDDRLSRNAKADNHRKSEEFRTFAAHPNHHEEHADRNRDQNEGQQPVGELDNAVDAHLRG